MSVRINTNVDALEAQRQLGLVSMDFSKAVQQLSSGLRINSAADDAAGLAISQKLQTQVRGFDQGARNAQDAVSLIQTGESALSTTHSMLQRMRQLSVQASNDTYTDTDRRNIQAEINQLISEIDRISQQTDFNTKKLLDGSAGGGQAIGGGPNVKALVIQANVAIA
ncbi:MAG TPA: flagellin, partial [Chloroflexota bacterium]|nr:flagellin [Chloroflexota bacterium]